MKPLLLSVLALCAASSAALAQHAAASAVVGAAAVAPWPGDGLVTDVPGQGSVHAATSGWKAGFTTAGVHFVPFAGSAVPSEPVTFHLAAITVGGEPIPVVDAAPELRGQQVVYARGSVQEIYRLRQDGIEQQFSFATLPARGELRVSIGVATGSRAERRADGHAFVGAVGGVHYGEATAFDANGRSIGLVATWTGTALELTVPAAFVATAALPLLIDPLIGPLTSFASITTEQQVTDVAYDGVLGQWYVTIERFYSATDHDVLVVCLDAALQLQWQLVIDISSEYWSKPAVATLAAHGVGCVVAETSAGNQSPFAVQARRFQGGASPVQHPVQLVASHVSYDRRDPDIGGDASPTGPSRFLLVWEAPHAAVNSTDIRFVQLDAAGTFTALGNLATGIGLHRRPKLSKTCGNPGGGTEQWVVVCREEYWQQTDGRLVAGFIGRNGQQRWVVGGVPSIPLTVLLPNAGSDWDVSSPTDHGSGRHVLCVESRVDAASGRAHLVGIVVDRNGNLPIGIAGIAAGVRDHRRPRVDSDGARFCVAHEVVYSATDSDVHVRTLRYHQGFLHEDDFVAATTSFDRESRPVVCSGPVNKHLVGWTHRTGNQHPIECRMYHGVAAGSINRRQFGCGGLTVQGQGSSELGGTVTFTLGGASGFAGFVAGAPVNLPIAPCPGCQQGAAGQTIAGTTLVIPIPVQPAMVGFPVAVQGFHFVPSGGAPCLGQVELSDALDFRVR